MTYPLIYYVLKYAEDSDYGMISIPHSWQDVGGGIWKSGGRDGSNLSGVEEDVSPMSGVRSGCRGGVSADTPSE